jgi:hypothetical protein
MSGQVTGWLLRTAPDELVKTSTDRSLLSVLAVLADRADPFGRHARLPVRDIAWRTLLSERWVQHLLRRAVDDGWVEVTEPGNSRWPTEYRFPHFVPVDNGKSGSDPALQSSPQRAAQSAPKRAAQSAPKRAVALRGLSQDVFDVKTSDYGGGPRRLLRHRAGARKEGVPPAPAGSGVDKSAGDKSTTNTVYAHYADWTAERIAREDGQTDG